MNKKMTIKEYTDKELKNELVKRKKEEEVVKGILESFEIFDLETIVINKLEENKQRIISEAIEDQQKKIISYIKNKNNYLAEKNIDARIGEKEIKKYITIELNSFYQQGVEELYKKTKSYLNGSKEGEDVPWGGMSLGHPGFSGSNGGPIGKLERVTYGGE